MPNPQVVHIARSDSDWQLRCSGNGESRYFHELGDAIDAASLLATNGEALRIVVHQQTTELAPDAENAQANPS
ncbi:MAG: hypothetical protein ABI305_11815 [Tepidiformaceae bacterium]